MTDVLATRHLLAELLPGSSDTDITMSVWLLNYCMANRVLLDQASIDLNLDPSAPSVRLARLAFSAMEGSYWDIYGTAAKFLCNVKGELP